MHACELATEAECRVEFEDPGGSTPRFAQPPELLQCCRQPHIGDAIAGLACTDLWVALQASSYPKIPGGPEIHGVERERVQPAGKIVMSCVWLRMGYVRACRKHRRRC